MQSFRLSTVLVSLLMAAGLLLSGCANNPKDPTAGWTPEKISRHGLGRSYQKTNVFLALSVWDNLMLAAQSRHARAPYNPLSWLSDASTDKAVRDRAERDARSAGEERVTVARVSRARAELTGERAA